VAPPESHGRLLRSSPWARAGAALSLTVLALIGALVCILDTAAVRAAGGLRSRLSGAATVVVWDHGLESADAAAARAAEIIAAVPAVAGVRSLDPAPADRLVAHLAGAPAADTRLLAVDASDGAQALPSRVGQALRAANLPARVTTRRGVGGRAVTLAMAAGLLLPLVALVAFAFICAREARRETVRAAGILELIHISGASDGYVAGLIRRRVGALALVCILWGAAGAMAAAALVSRLGVASALGAPSRHDLVCPWPLFLVAAWLSGLASSWIAARVWLRASP
jgi:cell division transport system permease protein